MPTLKFDELELVKSEEYYSHIHLAQEQKVIINTLAELLSQFTGMRLLPMKGFLWKAIKKWQIDTKTDTSEIAGFEPEKRIESVSNIFKILGDKLKLLLKGSNHELLDKAISDTLDFYIEKWAHR